MNAPQKKLHIKTFGCQMNVYDSERIAETLAPLGFSLCEDAADADLVVLNTCHIREKAAEKVYSDLGRLRQLKARRADRGKRTVIAVAGCVAQAEGREIIERSPVVDLVIGPQSYHRLPELLPELERGGRAILETEFPEDDKFRLLPGSRPRPRSPSAFLTIQEGCDKFCTFCVVPYTRGTEYSRPVVDIEAEARNLVGLGAKELTLLGQNVNACHGEGPDRGHWSLARLLRQLAEIGGLERLRYTTSHPRDVDDELIAVHAQVGKVMPYLHLPFQAGSDRILAAMNRQHTGDDYIQIAERIRAARPDIALSTDIIVGFPGETDEDFAATLDLVERVGFAQAYSFKYSPRPGTPAAGFDDQVPDQVKSERLQSLQALLDRQKTAFNAGFLGRKLQVLFEGKGRKPGQLVGRSPYLQPVHATGGPELLGQVSDVEITGVAPNSLEGDIMKLAQFAQTAVTL